MIIVDDIIQGSDQWHDAKCGVPSSSNFSRIVKKDGSPSGSQDGYIWELAEEIITGEKLNTFQSRAMQTGTAREPDARKLYSFIKDVEVKEVGVCYRDEEKSELCSPDGLMEKGGVEIKSPLLKTHDMYLYKNELPAEYHRQVHGSLWVTGLEYWDFMSYFPNVKPLIIRVYPDVGFMNKLAEEMQAFNEKLNKTVKRLKEA